MKKSSIFKIILASVITTLSLSGCDEVTEKPEELMGDIPYEAPNEGENNSDGFVKVDPVAEGDDTVYELAGDVPYVEENTTERGEIPENNEEDDDFVKVDPVGDEAEVAEDNSALLLGKMPVE